MSTKQKFKIILALIALVTCIFQINQTYAKYLEKKDGDTDFNIAKWKITVNDKDITEAATMSSIITPVYTENDNVANGVIAPGSEGYFDLNIDGSKTEVSFRYNISIAASETSAVKDLQITKYQINNESPITTDGTSEVANTINYNAPNKNISIRVYFKWLDGDGESMSNEDDTNASLSGDSAKLKVSMTFTQVA